MGYINNTLSVFKAETLVFPTTGEPEAGGLQVSPYSTLQSEFKASPVSLLRPCLKMKREKGVP